MCAHVVRFVRAWYVNGACEMRVCTCVSVCVSSRPLEDCMSWCCGLGHGLLYDCMLLMMWIRTWSIGGPREAGGVD